MPHQPRTKNSRLVYSTEQGRLCPGCHQPAKQCNCRPQTAKGDGVVRISRETKGRKGKGVTLITGLSLPDKELKALAKKLKQLCGCGGTIKAGVIEIQSDDRERLQQALISAGFTTKIAGG
jgi:translation initiation factor 1